MRNSRVLITQHNCLSPFGKNLEEMLRSLQSEKTYISSFQSTLQKISIKEKFVGLLKDQIEVESLLFKDLEVVSINTEEKIKEIFQNLLGKQADLIIFATAEALDFFDQWKTYNKKSFDPFIRTDAVLNYLKKNKVVHANSEVIKINNSCASTLAGLEIAQNFLRSTDAKNALIISIEDSNLYWPRYVALGSMGITNQIDCLKNLALPAFYKSRCGTIKADAVGYLFLEKESAFNQKDQPWALLKSVESIFSSDNISENSLDGRLVNQLLEKCLHASQSKKEDISYINLHGAGTKANDASEANGLLKFFDQETKKIPMTSTKCLMGHAMAASGTAEVSATLLMMRHNFISVHLPDVHEENEFALFLPKNIIKNYKIKSALKTSLGFGGYNSIAEFENVN